MNDQHIVRPVSSARPAAASATAAAGRFGRRLPWLAAVVLCGSAALYGCASEAPEGLTDSVPVVTAESPAVSPVALKIEQASRILERNGDIGAAKIMLNQALSAADATAQERVDAVVALSRAHEASGDREQAISVVEEEVANKSHPERNVQPLRERLSELLMPEHDSGHSAPPDSPVSAFAGVLADYAQPDQNGRHLLRFFMAGGDAGRSTDLGTFNVQGALREQREQECPLCSDPMKLSSHVRQSNWMVIPESQAQFDGAFLIFYFDMEKNRIPARYEHYLPMPVSDISRELADGKSFVVAKERPGSPPAVLLAAPRTSMLWDVEQHLAGLDALPLEPVYVEVSRGLRPHEIRSVMRQQMLEPLRSCYDDLRESDKSAQGKIVLRFVIDGKGAVQELLITTDDDSLEQADFVDCVSDAGKALRFPASGEQVKVNYPFVLSHS